eukprot:3208477-Alexandrium_andersonii.AAC.1
MLLYARADPGAEPRRDPRCLDAPALRVRAVPSAEPREAPRRAGAALPSARAESAVAPCGALRHADAAPPLARADLGAEPPTVGIAAAAVGERESLYSAYLTAANSEEGIGVPRSRSIGAALADVAGFDEAEAHRIAERCRYDAGRIQAVIFNRLADADPEAADWLRSFKF